MSHYVGVLVHDAVIARGRRGRVTAERLDLYRRLAMEADESLGGARLLLFGLHDVHRSGRTVRGYEPTAAGWRRAHRTMPRVIHKRVLHRTRAENARLRRWQRNGIVIVNPPLMNDKGTMHRILFAVDALRPHLPVTETPLRVGALEGRLAAGESMILKPRRGSVGVGVLKVVPLPGALRGYVKVAGSKTRVWRRAVFLRRVRRRLNLRRYLMQKYVPLARLDGAPFDLRVPVQRDGDGRWQVEGVVAKVAVAHPFLTNIAQGGRAIPGRTVIARAFSPALADTLLERVHRLAVDVGEAVAGYYEGAADLGLDIGLDRDGHPWLIEVNTRDQRITFSDAGMHDALRRLYHNPLAYCARLARMGESGTGATGEGGRSGRQNG